MRSSAIARGWRWGSLVLLLVVGASRWLLASAKPETEPTAASMALGCAWAAMLLAGIGVRSLPPGAAAGVLARGTFAGAMLIGGPVLGLVLNVPGIEAGSLVMALALTPVVVGVAASALGSESSESLTGRIWPGIAAVAGLLLVLAEPSLGDTRANALLLLAPVLAGVGAALFASAQARMEQGPHEVQEDVEAWLPSVALLGGAFVLALGWVLRHHSAGSSSHLSLTAVAADGVGALLTVLVLARLGAVRWSAQFTLLPLLILLEGIALVRPVFTTRWVLGLVLLAVASVYLLLPEVEPELIDPPPQEPPRR